MSASAPPSVLVYFVIGLVHSGPSTVISELISFEGGAQGGAHLMVYEQDPLTGATLTWGWDDAGGLAVPEFPVGTEVVFWVSDGRGCLVSQIEALRDWLAQHPECVLARVLSVVDCAHAFQNEAALVWYQAAVHFADCVFLSQSAQVPAKWLSQFQDSFQPCPCLFVRLDSKGKIPRKAEVLDPLPLRLTQVFDEVDPENPVPEDFYLAKDRYGLRRRPLPEAASL